MSYKVSVIIPIYNIEKLLIKCLDSLAQQTLQDIQVIMVDDGSTDASKDIVNDYAKRYENFEAYHKINGGSASARNVGLDHATGEYIGFVDSDDWVEPDMYERMYRCAKEHYDTDIIFCRVYEDETPGAREYIFPRGGYYTRDEMKQELIPYLLPCLNEKGGFRNIRWSNCIRVFKRNVIENNHIRFFEKSRRCEDLAFSFECTLAAKDYFYMDDACLYHNYPNENSKTRKYTQNMWQSIRELVLHINEVCDAARDIDLTAYKKTCSFYFAMISIRNEMKAPDKETAVRNISQIVSDEVCLSSLDFLEAGQLKKELSGLRDKMKSGDAREVFHYLKQAEFKSKYILPIISKGLSVAPVRKIYQMVRGR